MDIIKILGELRSEKTAVDEAILVLERLMGGHAGKARRGRPPGSKRRPFSAETKARMAIAQRRRWAIAMRALVSALKGRRLEPGGRPRRAFPAWPPISRSRTSMASSTAVFSERNSPSIL